MCIWPRQTKPDFIHLLTVFEKQLLGLVCFLAHIFKGERSKVASSGKNFNFTLTPRFQNVNKMHLDFLLNKERELNFA